VWVFAHHRAAPAPAVPQSNAVNGVDPR
jgi:hypothetical protein